jgi:hypothetical protein
MPRLLRDRAKEADRLLQQQAAAITRLAILGHRSSMRQARQGRDRRFHQPVAGMVVQVGDQPEPAAVALKFLPVQAAAGTRIEVGHGMAPERPKAG